jgi:hypothetical protein
MGYQKFSDAWRHAEISTEGKPATLGALGALGGVITSRRGIKNREITPRAIDRAPQICPVGAPKAPKVPKAGPHADAFAALEARCPDYVPADRWQQAIDDGRAFLNQSGEQADALGWIARDLFDLHQPPDHPHPSYSRLSRYDETGLIWLLQGRPVVALTEATAAIENLTGAITLYRKDNKPELGPVGDCLDDFR